MSQAHISHIDDSVLHVSEGGSDRRHPRLPESPSLPRQEPYCTWTGGQVVAKVQMMLNLRFGLGWWDHHGLAEPQWIVGVLLSDLVCRTLSKGGAVVCHRAQCAQTLFHLIKCVMMTGWCVQTAAFRELKPIMPTNVEKDNLGEESSVRMGRCWMRGKV